MIVIFDLKSTCWHKSDSNQKISEIIEIGAVKYDEEQDKIVDTFNIFVTPVLNPILSKFCKNLTSIKQFDIDNGIPFSIAIETFNTWCSDSKYIFSWGFYDKHQIERECFLKKNNCDILDQLKKKHRSLKHEFSKIFGCKPPGMTKALEMIGIKLQGTHYRGIDDAKNILEIYKKVKDKLKK